MAPRKRRAAVKSAEKENRVKIGKGLSLKREQEEKLSKRPGSSNVGKYKKVSGEDFCGPSGGAAPGTYPINSKKRCSAALSYAHNALNPSGIRACVKRKCGKKK